MKTRSDHEPIRGGIKPFWEADMGINPYPNMKHNWGYNLWRKYADENYYPDIRDKPYVIIMFPHKLFPREEKNIVRALNEDFGFNARCLNRPLWKKRGIEIWNCTNVTKMKKEILHLNKYRLGRVVIIASPRHHKLGSYIDKNKHHVIYSTTLISQRFPYLKIFKAAQEYLNIDPNVFYPE